MSTPPRKWSNAEQAWFVGITVVHLLAFFAPLFLQDPAAETGPLTIAYFPAAIVLSLFHGCIAIYLWREMYEKTQMSRWLIGVCVLAIVLMIDFSCCVAPVLVSADNSAAPN